ncbi:MAG TPA: putative Ig domain-containing protein [Fimbriimonadaceae bacterium]|nr:putative Ig domain-containing protein [Fimbriimonadaceae bacterium]
MLALSAAGFCQYTFVDLHDPAHNQTTARAKFGNVIAGYSLDGPQGEVLSWVGASRTPTELIGTTEGDAFAVYSNNVVGWLKNDALAHRAFIWNPKTGSLTDLSPTGAHASIAYGVFANQQVGSMYTPQGQRATIWSGTAQSAVDIHPVGYGDSIAYCTNFQSQAGYATVNNVGQAVLWNSSPLAVSLHPAGYEESMVLSMYQGVQVGRARVNGWNRAMRWAGTLASATEIHPAGYDDSGCTAIWGDKIVGWGRNESDFHYHALVWDANTNTATSLNSFLPPEYTDAQANGIDPLTGDIVGIASDGFSIKAVMWKADSSNQDPTLNLIGDQTIVEDSESRIPISGFDPDENDVVAFELGAAPAGITIEHGSTGTAELIWSPTEAQGPGVFQVTVCITDNRGGEDSETFTITVEEDNMPPAINGLPEDITLDEGDELSLDLTTWDGDIPAQTLTFSLVSGPTGLTLSPTGELRWQTGESDGGLTHIVTIELSDGVDTVEGILNVHVSEGNTPPDVTNPGNQSVAEEETLTLQISASDVDEPAQTLTYYLDEGGQGMNLDSNTGELTWTPTEEDGPQTRSVQISVSDGVDSTIINFDIVVEEVNQPPSIGTDGDLDAEVDQEVTFTATAQDDDIPENTLTFSLDGAPDGATIDETTGEFSWTPTEPGEFSFDVVVTDDGDPEMSDSETITIIVTGAPNQPPVLEPIGAQTIDELQPLSIDANATDPDQGQTLTYSLTNAPAGMTIDPANGQITFTPTEAQGPGLFTVTVTVTDDGDPAQSDMEIVLVTVNEVNQTPVFTMGTNYSVDERQLLTIQAIASDDDLPAQMLMFALVDEPAGMTINSLTGLLTWTPTEAQGPGSYTFDLIVSDGNGGLAAMPIYVTVNEVEENNQPPIADAGEDQTVRVPHDGSPITILAWVTLDGSNSFDPENSVLQYEWHDSTGLVSTESIVEVERSPGVYSFDLIVRDADGAAATDQVIVTVLPETNSNPVSLIDGSPRIHYVHPHDGVPGPYSHTFTLSGSQSFDPDGDDLAEFHWRMATYPYANFASGITASRTLSQAHPLWSTSEFVQLHVIDSYGYGGQSSALLELSPEPNSPPVTRTDQVTITLGITTTIPVLQNDFDPDGDQFLITSALPTNFSINGAGYAHVVVTPDKRGLTIASIPAIWAAGKVTIRYYVMDPYPYSLREGLLIITFKPPTSPRR